MTDDGYKLLFDSDQVHILENFELPDYVCIVVAGSRDKKTAFISFILRRMSMSISVLEISQDETLWHQRLSHLNH